jgi:hypothetical protein
MPDRVLTTPQRSELHYIGLAAELAGGMIRELQCLEANNSRLALSMATAGALAQRRLLSLLSIIEWLRLTRDAEHAVDLIAHAKALLMRLAGELEQLAAEAGCDFKPSVPRWDRLGISSMLDNLRNH